MCFNFNCWRILGLAYTGIPFELFPSIRLFGAFFFCCPLAFRYVRPLFIKRTKYGEMNSSSNNNKKNDGENKTRAKCNLQLHNWIETCIGINIGNKCICRGYGRLHFHLFVAVSIQRVIHLSWIEYTKFNGIHLSTKMSIRPAHTNTTRTTIFIVQQLTKQITSFHVLKTYLNSLSNLRTIFCYLNNKLIERQIGR